MATRRSSSPTIRKKATGDPEEIARYLRIFGNAGRVAHEVVV